MNISKRLRELRETSGFSQATLSGRAGVSRDIVSRIERGHKASPAILRLLATALGLPADYFLDPQPEPEPEARTRLVLELETPKGFVLTDDEADLIGRRFRHWGKDMINLIIELRGKN